MRDAALLTNLRLVTDNDRIAVILPDGSTIRSTHTATLDLPTLPLAARHAHVFPDLIGSLISIGVLTDHGMTALYDATTVTIYSGKTAVLRGLRSPDNRLWFFDLAAATSPDPPPAVHSAAAMFPSNSTHMQIVAWYHATLGSPAVPTMLAAVDRGYVKFPGLTAAMIRKYPPQAVATSQGHLDQRKQGLQSTKSQPSAPPTAVGTTVAALEEEIESDLHPAATVPQPPAHTPTVVLTRVVTVPPRSGKRATDLTGRYPRPSKRGNQYCMVMFCEDENYIHVEPLHCREQNNYVKAYTAADSFFRSRGIIPRFERLDNETSKQLERFCRNNEIKVQYCPPGMHRANKAERAIRTWKNHFISTLYTADPSFPISSWDELLEHAELTLNLMRTSGRTEHISAWHQVHGAPFDFMSTPIAPPGIRIVTHDKPSARGSWAPHGEEGFYVGPALNHYRCFRVITKSTQSERITDTASWHPSDALRLPGASLHDTVIALLTHLQVTLDRLAISPTAVHHERQPLQAAIPPLTSAIQSLIDVFSDDSATAERDPPPTAPPAVQQPLHSAPTAVVTVQPTTAAAPAPISVNTPAVQRVLLNNTPRATVAAEPPQQAPLVAPPPPASLQPTATRHSQRVTRAPAWLSAQAVMEYHICAALMDTTMMPKRPVAPLSYGSAKRGPNTLRWEQAESEEFLRLIEETQTMHFILRSQIAPGRMWSYYNPQVKIKIKEGVETYRVRGTYGGDKGDYEGDRTAWVADLTTIKIMLNAAVSEDADFICADIKDFYLGTTLERPEYMRIHKRQIPRDIQLRYNLDSMWDTDDCVFVEINKGIYGLPQAGKLAQERLVQQLAKHGYHAAAHTPLLFKHITRPISFALVVDDFGIKVKGLEHAEHLFAALRELYTITVDYKGAKFIGISIAFDRVAKTVSLSMPGYIENALERFGITLADYATDSPAVYVTPTYGSKLQQLTTVDSSAELSAADTKFIQQVIGVLAYYARAVDATMITTVHKIGSQQAHPTAAIMEATQRLLQYAANYPDAVLVYHASDMHYVIHSDASYLSETNSRSRAGGLHFLTNNSTDDSLLVNGALECISTIIPTVVASACEAEYAAMYLNATSGEGIRNTLADFGYPQQATPLISDNTGAVGISNKTVTQRRSKSIAMRYHWLQDRIADKHFKSGWQRGKSNLADYFTKTHPVRHFKHMRKYYVRTGDSRQKYPVRYTVGPTTDLLADSEGVLEQGTPLYSPYSVHQSGSQRNPQVRFSQNPPTILKPCNPHH